MQCSVSFNKRRGTLRGMHFQMSPHEEQKFVRCTAGSIHDVVLDLRPGSKSFGRWAAVELSSANQCDDVRPQRLCARLSDTGRRRRGVLPDDRGFSPACAGRVRFDDPTFGITWPIA